MKLLCFNMQKSLVFVMIIVMVSSCFGVASPRKTLIGGREERITDNGVGIGVKKEYTFPNREIDNHHNIPREYYSQRGNNSTGGAAGGGDNGDK
ncbi:hypothetical protein A4A49_02782 [Nicotiana attenuata]|uniref:Uncharacterized protein n=1 Tax=Nicotiana attenuata TaxID=49451 RepID=A0A1J6J240_NICAT|nr:hypothetical protein A4A49_02782 [Nicotiana attenuata]